MKILVCGGRGFGDMRGNCLASMSPGEREARKNEYVFVHRTLDRLSLGWPKLPEDELGNWLPDVTIIHGGASGADSAAYDWAVSNWCHVEPYEADWEKYGRAAGPMRNRRMIEEGRPDLVVAFPGGRGTVNMKLLARAAGIEVTEVEYTP